MNPRYSKITPLSMMCSIYVWYSRYTITISGIKDTWTIFMSGSRLWTYALWISSHQIFSYQISEKIEQWCTNHIVTSRNLWLLQAYILLRILTGLNFKFDRDQSKCVTSMLYNTNTHLHRHPLFYPQKHTHQPNYT